MAEAAAQRMSLAAFLEWDDGSDVRYELIDGRPVAMAPVPAAHSIIVGNLGAALRSALSPPCYVGVEAGVTRPDRDDLWYEADLVVSCTLPGPGAALIPEPVVIVEVLSPSTLERDRGRKLYDYRRIPSVHEIALVSSEQRHVEIWRRRGPKWEVEDLIGEARLALDSVRVEIPFARLFADSGL